jgi:hypothetical protein
MFLLQQYSQMNKENIVFKIIFFIIFFQSAQAQTSCITLAAPTQSNPMCTNTCITLVAPTPLSLTCTKIDISGYGRNNGQATASVSGGKPPYTYLWNNGATSANVVGLGKGTFSIVIKDSKNCSVTCNLIIVEPDPCTQTICVPVLVIKNQ